MSEVPAGGSGDPPGKVEQHRVLIENCASTYVCPSSQTVLRGMENLGRRNIPVGCREGGCGICKVEILSGRWRARRMSRAHVSVEEEQQGRVLACCIWPESDLTLRVLGAMVKTVCRLPWELPVQSGAAGQPAAPAQARERLDAAASGQTAASAVQAGGPAG